MKIHMTLSGPRLRHPADPALAANHIYGVPTLYPVSPTAVVAILNIRVIGAGQVDFENGADAIVFDSLDRIDPAAAVPLVRNEPAMDPVDGTRYVLVHHAPNGGFVPLGATLPDGRPHPAAGTGFGISPAGPHLESAPLGASPKGMGSGRVKGFKVLLQYRYDGRTFRVVSRSRMEGPWQVAGWTLLNRGLGTAVADGEDLLFGVTAGRDDEPTRAHGERLAKSGRPLLPNANRLFNECTRSGLSRWRFSDGAWRPVAFVPVTGPGPDMSSEPSVVRDTDGSLLFSVRGRGSNAPAGEFDEGMENTYEHFRVYRSRDNGATWEKAVHLAEKRAPTPVVINVLADGRPYLAANPFKPLQKDAKGRTIYKTRVREELMAWPLTADRRGVEEPSMLLDANAVFGPVPQYDELPHINHWHLDHAQGTVCRLADGKTHALLAFRCTDTALCGFGLPPPPQAGTWIEEISGE